MSNKDMLDKIQSNSLGLKKINIINIKSVDEYLFIELDNNQKILTNGKEVYDVSEYNHLCKIITMENRLCAVLTKGYSTYVIDLNTKEQLFADINAQHVSKEDERTLHIITRTGKRNINIYDIKTKKYLPVPENYEYENALGNNLYVFREDRKADEFLSLKRCIINADGKTILENIEGYIVEFDDNHFIIKNENEIQIIKIGKDVNKYVLNKTDNMIAAPEYHNGKIIIMEIGLLKVYNLDFELINEFEINELDSVNEYEMIGETLKIRLPYKLDGKNNFKEIFININSGKSISHLRINGYPYWNHETVVGQDSIKEDDDNNKQIDYHFYDANLNEKINIKGNYCREINDSYIFEVGTYIDNKNIKRKYINTKTNIVKECVYDIIRFLQKGCGYAFNTVTDMIDIVDENLDVIIANINYKKLKITKSYSAISEFRYFVVNKYVCITMYIDTGEPYSLCKRIIQNANGDIILNSTNHRCTAIGDYIQITKDGESKYLNTTTGQIGTLSIEVPVDDKGMINLKEININNTLSMQNPKKLLLQKKDD